MVILGGINIAIINAEIEILKIKIIYRRKIAIFQNLRRENAGEKFEFYVIIEKDIPSISKKRARFFSVKKAFILAISNEFTVYLLWS
jgi:hypothetical protein